MKLVGFIGVYDKVDMLLNISKILTAFNKKVLIADLTKTQKTRYIVPSINPTIKYVTNFEDIDVAIGFKSLEEIEQYFANEEEKLPYDIILFDIDTHESLSNIIHLELNEKYFVTGFDLYSLKQGLSIFDGLLEEMELSKVLFSTNMIKEEDDYLNFLSQKYNVKWKDYRIYFPFENGDMSVCMENQRLCKIKLKKLSPQYKDGITYITEDILDEKKDVRIRKVIKNLEKGE